MAAHKPYSLPCKLSVSAFWFTAVVPLSTTVPLCLASVPQAAWAQEQARTTEYPTLAAALADATSPATDSLVVSVGADRVKLPPLEQTSGVPRLNSPATVQHIVRRFDLIARPFGSVTAIAPATMVRINTQPANANFYEGMPPSDILTLLLGTLNETQWQSITGPNGLPVASLTMQEQKQLVRALLPQGKLSVAPWYSSYSPRYKPEEVRDVTASLPQARLRLSQSFSVMFPDEKGQGFYQSDEVPPAPDASARFKLTDRRNYGESQESLYGVLIRETVPNREKPTQLPLTDARLKVAVTAATLKSFKTVGDLIDYLRTVTGMDLFADPRYSALSFTTLSAPGVSASAADLLRAVALSATATYRRVGPGNEPRPAYILTDDLVGMGTRQELWYEFELDGDALRAGPVSKAAQSLYTRFGARSIRPQDSDALLATPGADARTTNSEASDYVPPIQKPFAELTQPQQEAVQRVVAQHNRVYTSQPGNANGRISLFPQVRLELLTTELPNPLDMNLSVPSSVLFRVPPDVAKARQEAREAAQQKQRAEYLAQHPEATPKPRSVPAQGSAAEAPSRRAVLLPVRLAADLDTVVADMQKLGFNELWLDLPLRPTKPDAPDAAALLKAALHATDKLGIKVFPVIAPFAASAPDKSTARRDTATANEADRNLLGETSADAEQHIQSRSESFNADPQVRHMRQEDARPLPPVYLNPLAPDVLSKAEAKVRQLAAQPGIGGIVFKDTTPPGYGSIRGGDDMSRRLIGYQDDMRLAFLHQFGADPVDLYTPNYYAGKAKTSVPIQERGEYLVSEKYQAWKKFRRDQNVTALRTLRAAAGSCPVLVQQAPDPQQGRAGLYVSWDDAKTISPTGYNPSDDDDLGHPKTEVVLPPPSPQSVLLTLLPSNFAFAQQFPARFGAAGTSSGFVLDLSAAQNTPQTASDPVKVLSALANNKTTKP